MLEIALNNVAWDKAADWPALAEKAVHAALAQTSFSGLATSVSDIEISIRLTSDEEVHDLNLAYRGKDKSTNVLSFPMEDAPEELEQELSSLLRGADREILLGDLVLAKDVCLTEAADKGISLADHATHLIVHGTLHLLGYDHIEDAAADEMEALEVKALASLGIANPYRD